MHYGKLFSLIGLFALVAAPALAQPSRTVRIISPAPPGGSTDIVSRLVAPALHGRAEADCHR